MSTRMTEADWEVTLEVFRLCLSRRGAKAKRNRLFLAALSPSEPVRGVRGVFRHAGGFERYGAHVSAAGAKGGSGAGRSRDGFSTKVHLKTDFDGLPVAFDLTGGQAADSPHFETSMGLRPDVRPRVIVEDKAYDSARNRQRVREKAP